jgi:hypothetical protein
MSAPPNRGWDRETTLVAQIAACVSVAAFLYYLRADQILLYGDAVAHINIARRVFDSRTPGPLQLGTVWLPLPHLLAMPFLIGDWLWQTGIGGSIPSLFAYVLGAVGIFRLVRGLDDNHAARIAAWLAAIIFICNPSLIYLQTTAMTESLYLALFIWAVVYFSEFVRDSISTTILKCGWCLAAASLTRYDGWFLIVVVATGVLGVAILRRPVSRLTVIKFGLLAGAGPVLWLAYNTAVYRNPLEFANGPYSAKAIEKRTSRPGSPPHPGTENLAVAASYFVKAAELNFAESNWHRLWLGLALAGTILLPVFERQRWPFLLLWFPVVFYALSIGYAGVPIFLPSWWPFSLYNARYGIELLPAGAVFSAVAVLIALRRLQDARSKIVVVAVVLLFMGLSYASAWLAGPISFREAWINSRTRLALEAELAKQLKHLPKDATFLMYLGDHVGAMQQAGIVLRRVINEGNHRTWKRPADPDGLWERALQNPARYADFVVAMDGDQVSRQVNKQQLASVMVVHVLGQPAATIYRTVNSTSQ